MRFPPGALQSEGLPNMSCLPSALCFAKMGIDGISGKANQVWDVSKKRSVLGRFGWKAGQPNLNQQYLRCTGISRIPSDATALKKMLLNCDGKPQRLLKVFE